jgi:hypothetical protein
VRNLNHVFSSSSELNDVYLDFYEGSNWKGILPSKLNIPPSMRSLTINWIDPPSLAKMPATAFENISVLKIHSCSDQLLAIIFDRFFSLKALLIMYSPGQPYRLSDEGFSGLDLVSMKSLKTEETYPILDEPLVDSMRIAPHVGKLKRTFNRYN